MQTPLRLRVLNADEKRFDDKGRGHEGGPLLLLVWWSLHLEKNTEVVPVMGLSKSRQGGTAQNLQQDEKSKGVGTGVPP